jgi:hypothetical protein
MTQGPKDALATTGSGPATIERFVTAFDYSFHYVEADRRGLIPLGRQCCTLGFPMRSDLDAYVQVEYGRNRRPDRIIVNPLGQSPRSGRPRQQSGTGTEHPLPARQLESALAACKAPLARTSQPASSSIQVCWRGGG